MKIFTFKRLLGMAALYGVVRYVRAHGGPKAVFDDLSDKARSMMDRTKATIDEARERADAGMANPDGGQGATGRGSYASYDVESDDKVRH